MAAIKPGITLKEFTSSGSVERALNFWDEVPGGLRDTVFFVGVSDGNTAVTDEVVCRFNERDILISCRRACCRSQSRSVTLEQYDSLRQGESRAMIENRLCTPSDTERDAAGRVKTYYHIALPIGEHWEGQTVLLAFEKDVLAFRAGAPTTEQSAAGPRRRAKRRGASKSRRTGRFVVGGCSSFYFAPDRIRVW